MNESTPADEGDLCPKRAFAFLATATLASAVVRWALLPVLCRPALFVDEWMHMVLAESLRLDGGTFWDGIRAPYPSWLYILAIAPLAKSLDVVKAHEAILALNCVLISGTIPAAYGLAREFASRRAALWTAGLTALMPGMILSGMVLTDVIFVPLAVLAMWAGIRAMVAPTVGRTLLAGAALGVLFHVKPAGLAFAPAYGLAAIAFAFLEARGSLGARASAAAIGPLRHAPAAIAWGAVLSLRFVATVWIEKAPEPFSAAAFLGLYSIDIMESGRTALLAFTRIPAAIAVMAACSGLLPAFSTLDTIRSARDHAPRALGAMALLVAAIALWTAWAVARQTTAFRGYVFPERFFVPLLPAMFAILACHPAARRRRGAVGWPSAVAGALVVIYGAKIALDSRSYVPIENPVLSSAILFFEMDGMGRLPALAFSALAGGALVAALLRPSRRAAIEAVALLLVAFNFGWYAVHYRYLRPHTAEWRRIAREVDRETDDGRLLVLTDDLVHPLMHYVGFRNPCSLVSFSDSPEHWQARKLRVRPDGAVVSPDGVPGTMLLAPASWTFDRPPVENYGLCALYRMDDSQPLRLAGESLARVRGEPAAPVDLGALGKRLSIEYAAVTLPDAFMAGIPAKATLVLRNSGDIPFPAAGSPLAIGYHWNDPERTGGWAPVVWDDGRHSAPLPPGLAPGEACMIDIEVLPPADPYEKWHLAFAPLLDPEGERIWIDSPINISAHWAKVLPPGAAPPDGLDAARDEIDFSPDLFTSNLRLAFFDPELPESFQAGARARVAITVRNDSAFPLPAGDYRAALGYHWSDPEKSGDWKAVVWDDGTRAFLDEPLAPGRRHTFEIDVLAPVLEGDAVALILALVLASRDDPSVAIWGPADEAFVARVKVERQGKRR